MGRIDPADKPVKKTKPQFPWLLLIAFLAALYFFWVLPYQMGAKPLDVEFSRAPSK